MELRGLEPKTNVFLFEYDCARDGGALGDHFLEGNPIGMERLLVRGYIEVKTPLESSGTAEIALSLKTPGDVLASAAWPAAGSSGNTKGDILPTTLDGSATQALLNEVQGARLVLTIAGAPVTAGRLIVALEGMG